MQENEGRFISLGNHSYTEYHEDMSDSREKIEYPYRRFHPRFARARISGIERGIDPKEKWMDYCKPSCREEEGMLTRCEEGIKTLKGTGSDNTCLFRYRQWVECIEGCTQPKVFYHLKGASRRGPLDWIKAHGPSGFH